MDTLKKTYSLSAALTLFLFVTTLVVPAGMAVASLNCDMDMSHAVCCVAADMNCHQEKKQETDDCQHQTFCEQSITNSPSETPAVTQNSTIGIAAELSEELTIVPEDSDRPPVIEEDPASLHPLPPIFLLNSTFLN